MRMEAVSVKLYERVNRLQTYTFKITVFVLHFYKWCKFVLFSNYLYFLVKF